MTELTRLSKSEAQLLDKLESIRDKPVDQIFPADMDPKEIVNWSKAIVSWYEKTDGEQAAKLHMLGCLHARARANSEVLKEAGCETIAEYEDKILGGKKHRATVWKYSSAYLAAPELSPQDAVDIGTTNLVVMTKLITEDMSSSQRTEIIKKAKKPTPEFKTWAEEESGLSHKGGTTMASFTMLGTAAEVSELREWLADKRFIQAASSNAPMMMVLSAIQSWSSEWPPEEGAEAAKDVADTEWK